MRQSYRSSFRHHAHIHSYHNKMKFVPVMAFALLAVCIQAADKKEAANKRSVVGDSLGSGYSSYNSLGSSGWSYGAGYGGSYLGSDATHAALPATYSSHGSYGSGLEYGSGLAAGHGAGLDSGYSGYSLGHSVAHGPAYPISSHAAVVSVQKDVVVKNRFAVPVPQPYPVPVEKQVPVPVAHPVPVHVDKPYPVSVPKPYPVPVERPVPYHVDKPYPVPQPYSVPVPVVEKVAVPVPQPYPVPYVRHQQCLTHSLPLSGASLAAGPYSGAIAAAPLVKASITGAALNDPGLSSYGAAYPHHVDLHSSHAAW